MSVVCLNYFRDHREIKLITVEALKFQAWNYGRDVRSKIEARYSDNLPKHFIAAMSKPQAQPYMFGDVHNVSYRAVGKNFNKPMPVPCEVTIDSCERDSFGNFILGSKCVQGIDEPFQFMDIKYRVTLNFLKSLPDGTQLQITTRSDLVAHADYIAEFKRLKVQIYILFPAGLKMNDWIRQNEPGAPSRERRVNAIITLREAGIEAQSYMHSIPVAMGRKTR